MPAASDLRRWISDTFNCAWEDADVGEFLVRCGWLYVQGGKDDAVTCSYERCDDDDTSPTAKECLCLKFMHDEYGVDVEYFGRY